MLVGAAASGAADGMIENGGSLKREMSGMRRG
jgi:hypothetical protein